MKALKKMFEIQIVVSTCIIITGLVFIAINSPDSKGPEGTISAPIGSEYTQYSDSIEHKQEGSFETKSFEVVEKEAEWVPTLSTCINCPDCKGFEYGPESSFMMQIPKKGTFSRRAGIYLLKCDVYGSSMDCTISEIDTGPFRCWGHCELIK